ncbi:protein mono-ADP-ribosyltransferase PARP14-like [Haliotis rufescens]|uniref:protein mono-ADP-ribosyltransferase PARP14-like n=1 Tax=Haliotis rufescens TaxID=6454 RepID=UPI00201FA13D|nr:protein mono-ADP-ribosyltransferase PARP14-like [Haliotis rufescens]
MATRDGHRATSTSPGLHVPDHSETALCPVRENVATAQRDLVETVREEVEHDLTTASASQDTSAASPGVGRLPGAHYGTETMLMPYQDDSCDLSSSGRKEGIEQCKSKFPRHDKTELHERFALTDGAAAMFLRSEKGRMYVSTVAQRNGCMIYQTATDPEGAVALDSVEQGQPATPSWHRRRRSSDFGIPDPESDQDFRSRLTTVRKVFPRKVELLTGSIAELKADVIVNSTNCELNLRAGALSASILQGAGNKLEKKVKKLYPHGIQLGDLAITKGYKLQCAEIYHATLPIRNTKERINEQNIKSIVTRCLEEASKKNHASLLFPAFGTGRLNYDKNATAKTIYETVNEFWENHPDTILKVVKVVISGQRDGIDEAFQEEHEKLYGKIHIRGSRRLSVQDEKAADAHVARGVLFGNVRFQLVEGDIMQQRVDLIVNGSNSRLELSFGMLSKKLRKRFGKELEKQCKEEVGNITKTGLAVTSVSDACFKAVLHYDTHFFRGIDKVLPALMVKADELKYTSLALPALDQGRKGGISKQKLAEYVHSSLTKHSGLRCLREVRMVIFEDTDLFDSLVSLLNTNINERGEGSQQRTQGHRSASATMDDDVKPLQRRGFKVYETEGYEVSIHSDCSQRIDQAIAELKSLPKIKQEPIAEECLVNLTVDKLKYLYDHAKIHSVGISVDTNGGVVNVMGFPDDVYNMMKHVYEICVDIRASQIEARAIQWYFVDEKESGEQVLKKYESGLNEEIERAFRSNAVEPECKLTTNDGVNYVINFNDMVEYKEGDKENTSVPVVRRNLTEISARDFHPPLSWEPMDPGENIKVVLLNQDDQEYRVVDNKFSVSRMKVVKIERIQNKTLYKQYTAKSVQFREPEMQLWHGTDCKAIPFINRNGFNRNYCGKHAAQYGNGVYFAKDASYSTQDRFSQPDSAGYKYIYLADVLTGEYTQGKKGMGVPPPLDPATPAFLFDSVVDDIKKPEKFVIFNYTQAYPKYLVTYKVLVDMASK